MNEIQRSCLIAVGSGLVAAACVSGAAYFALKATGNEETLIDIRHKWMRSVSSTENKIRTTGRNIRSALKPDEEMQEEDKN